MNSFRLALAQSCSGDQVQVNLDWARLQMAEAAARGAQLVVLPECILCQAKPEGIAPAARPAAEWNQLLGALSKEHKLPAVWGGVPELRDGKVYNSSLCFDAEGASLGIYRKTHLFQLFAGEKQVDETATYAFGDGSPLLLHLGGWSFGLTICYDLRFPELWRRYAGADCILNTAAFTRKPAGPIGTCCCGPAPWKTSVSLRPPHNAVSTRIPASPPTDTPASSIPGAMSKRSSRTPPAC